MNLSAGEFLRLTSALSKKEFFVPQLFNFRELNVADYFQNLMNLQASSTSLRRNLKVNLTLYSFIATIVKHLQKCTTFKT